MYLTHLPFAAFFFVAEAFEKFVGADILGEDFEFEATAGEALDRVLDLFLRKGGLDQRRPGSEQAVPFLQELLAAPGPVGGRSMRVPS